MAVEHDKALVKRYIEQGWKEAASGNLDAVHEYLHDHYVNRTPVLHDHEAKGVQAVKDAAAEHGSATQDFTQTADYVVGEGAMVVAHWTTKGTHTGAHRHRHGGHVQASSEQFTVSGLAMFRLEGGKIAESWNYDNHLDFLLRVGALQGMPGQS